MVNFKKTRIPLFRRFVLQNFPFIEQDFDALTDYELICKVVEYLNKVIVSTNANSEQVEILTDAFNDLQSYVDHYFDNLDVQEEINNKLDAMVDDGTLQEIVADYLNSRAVFGFDTVSGMKSATNLIDGSYAETLGYYAKGDGGSALYKIREITNDDIVDEMFIIEIASDPSNNLVAELVVKDKLHSKQLGIKGDGVTDETAKLNKLLDNTYNVNIVVDAGIYLTTGTVYMKGLWRQDSGNNGQRRIVFNDATIYYTGTAGNASVVLYNMFKYYVSGLCIARNSASNYVEIVGCWHLSYCDWDINDLHIDNETTNLAGKIYSTTSDEYVAGNNIYVKGTLTIGASSGSYNNVINFYNSIFNSTGKSCCVKLLGATSKQNIQFFSCDLSYATNCIYDVDTAQTGGCSITAIGCYYDSGIKIFENDDKKSVVYTSIASFLAANTNQEMQNILFTNYNKDMVISNSSPFGNSLPVANVNYAINGDLSYQSNESGNYNYLMGASSSDWSKSYVDDAKCINGKARHMVLNNAGNKGFDIATVTAPRTDNYCAFLHFKVASGSFTELKITFKSQTITIPSSRIGNNEVVIINNKANVSVSEGTSLNFGIVFEEAEAGLTLDFYEVGVTA